MSSSKRKHGETLNSPDRIARVDTVLKNWRRQLEEREVKSRDQARYVLRILPLRNARTDTHYRGSMKFLEMLGDKGWNLEYLDLHSIAGAEPAVFYGDTITNLLPFMSEEDEKLLGEMGIQYEVANYAHLSAPQLVESMNKTLGNLESMLTRPSIENPSSEDIRRGKDLAVAWYKRMKAQLRDMAYELNIADEVLNG